jgi:glycolate dehydrogenase FAD-binding subunit
MNGLLEKVRALLGPDAVLDPGGGAAGIAPRIAPPSIEAAALLLGTATAEGWKVRVEGAGSWQSADAPADLALATRRLDQVESVEPQDLVATAQAGIGWDRLRQQLADRGVWVALDPPGLAGRTIGSILATATSGPLRQGFGAVRDQLLGLTAVTGDGRVVTAGGRVVKNVAGYDLTRLQTGAFAAFGVIARVHLRLRALPRADLTLVLEGPREELSRAADELRESGLGPAALELLSPALARRAGWVLAVRCAGSVAQVEAEEATVRAAAGGRFARLGPEESHAFWQRAAEGLAVRTVTFRLGGLPDSTDDLLDLLQHQLGDEWISAAPALGVVRWSGEATAEHLRRLRRTLAALEVPLTLERAPWELRRSVGIFGAYREGIGPLVAGLRRTFDPAGTLVVPVATDE